MTVTPARLDEIYASSDDPWDFATSAYEQARFRATRGALSKPAYRAALEIGCGNGELARHLTPLCESYTGLDAVQRALRAAQMAVPTARFVQGYYPCPLPDGDYDLIVISEFLYFLGQEEICTLARELGSRWPVAELICVTYLGETGHILQGEEALGVFITAHAQAPRFELRRRTDLCRIDRMLPEDVA